MSVVLALEYCEQLAQLPLHRFDRLQTQRRAGNALEIAGLAVLVHLLTRALDRVLLRVQQMLYQENHLDLLALIHAVARAILGRIEKAELAFPVAQHMGLEVRDFADFSDGEVFLDRFGTHASCSARSSRDISS